MSFRINNQALAEPAYLCPLSLSIVLNSESNAGRLSVEHVPPASLGGKPFVLTSTKHNNQDGHSSDMNLLRYFEGQNFQAGKGEIPVKISSPQLDFTGMNARFSFNAKEKVEVILSSSTKIINALDYKGLFKNWDGSKFSLQWTIQKELDKRAILKCAYLTAFRHLGYRMLIDQKGFKNNTYGQLTAYLNGSETPFPTVIIPGHAPLEQWPIGLVNQPSSLTNLFVNLTFSLKGFDYKYVVFLPHPSATSLDNLQQLHHQIEAKPDKIFDFSISELSPVLLFT